MGGGILVVTAVAAEAEAVSAGLITDAVTVEPVGVGPAAAAAGTARLIALAEAGGRPYRGVVSAGIGGGFPGRVPVGGVAVATHSIAADLGAESPDGFLSVDDLGFGATTLPADRNMLAVLLAGLPHAVPGLVLTLSTATGSAQSTTALLARHPDAVAEAMEGYGVAVAAVGAGLPFAELRAISNLIGPRDRSAWRIGAAFAALTAAFAVVGEKL